MNYFRNSQTIWYESAAYWSEIRCSLPALLIRLSTDSIKTFSIDFKQLFECQSFTDILSRCFGLPWPARYSLFVLPFIPILSTSGTTSRSSTAWSVRGAGYKLRTFSSLRLLLASISLHWYFSSHVGSMLKNKPILGGVQLSHVTV